MKIAKLSDEIINQIAAGEVIENPSAVIKELVENSIDSGANIIEVSLEDFGLSKIIITDNGCGISNKDLLLAPKRHATSKIKSFSDLYSISTMGFRGEALASIFSIAKTIIISKCENSKKAYEISSLNINKVTESSGKVGTTIIVEDLFYNTPARKKYLRSNNLELKSIIDIINRFEVFYENIKFVLKHNSKILVNKPQLKSKLQNIQYVLGRDLKNNLFELNFENNGIKVSGFVGKPSNITYSFRKNQYLYVNSRFIKSKLIRDAIYEGFGSNLMTNRHPFFVLFIEIDPEIIDVNVHPTKIEIRFENELEIYNFIKSSIEKIFEEQESFKDFEEEKVEKDLPLNKVSIDFEENVQIKVKQYPIQKKNLVENIENKYYSKENQKNFEVKEDVVVFEKQEIKTNFSENISNLENENLSNDKDELNKNDFGPLYYRLSDYKILGQLNKTYIIIQTPKEMILIDQHVAEEKFYYEKFKKNFENKKKGESQFLLKSLIVHLTNSEILLYKENLDILENLGFKTEEFGNNEILIRAVPINIRKEIVSAQNLKDILYDILVNKKIKCVEEENYSKIASMACRISIMAGDELTNPQMKRIIENLRYLKQPFNCPHGRPTFLKYTYYELDKKFKRIV